MRFDGLVIYLNDGEVLVDRVSVRLSETEHRLLCFLAGNAGPETKAHLSQAADYADLALGTGWRG